MKGVKRRFVGILTALALLAGLCTPIGGLLPAAGAAEIIAQGDTSTRGDIHWELDSEGTFTLSGNGRPPVVSPSMVITPWDDYKNQIRRVVIEEGVWSTGEYSFAGCTSLVEVELASSVTAIGDGAFSGCTNLTSVAFPSALHSIGSSAFSGCTGLTELNFPGSLESIGSRAFSGCAGLTEADIPRNASVGPQAFVNCTGLQKAVLPDKNAVGQSAFAYCTSLTEVYWPLGLTNADQYFHDGSGRLTVYYEGSQADWDDIGVPYLGQKIPEGTTVHYNCDMPLWVDDTPEDTPLSVIPTPILNAPCCTEEGVYISWTVPLETLDRKNTVDGYYVFRKTGGGDYQLIGEVAEYSSHYTDTTVQEGQTYTYTVQAHYQGETGDYDQAGKAITFIRPASTLAVDRVSMIINGSLHTDTLWTGAESDIWIYLTEDADFPSESDPGYVVLTDRESGKQLWRSEELSYYTSDSTHRIDIVFDPKDCEGGYLPSGRKVQFQVREDSGEQICSYDCETFSLQLWSFDSKCNGASSI
nr:fibronectin type III domain-containing protein [uncultured Agathobaculum sp.]